MKKIIKFESKEEMIEYITAAMKNKETIMKATNAASMTFDTSPDVPENELHLTIEKA